MIQQGKQSDMSGDTFLPTHWALARLTTLTYFHLV